MGINTIGARRTGSGLSGATNWVKTSRHLSQQRAPQADNAPSLERLGQNMESISTSKLSFPDCVKRPSASQTPRHDPPSTTTAPWSLVEPKLAHESLGLYDVKASPFSVFTGSVVGASTASNVFSSSRSVDLFLSDLGSLTSGEQRLTGRTPRGAKL